MIVFTVKELLPLKAVQDLHYVTNTSHGGCLALGADWREIKETMGKTVDDVELDVLVETL